jgi:hypothetical protein
VKKQNVQKIKSSYTPELGKSKQQLYEYAYKRVQSSTRKGSHIEAIALLESIMSDRIESAISSLTRKPVSASSLGSLFKLLDKLSPAEDDLKALVWDWNESRGLVIHQMVKLTNDYNSTWAERVKFAKITAQEGIILLPQLRRYTDRIIREARKS